MTDLYQYKQCGEPNRPRRLLCHASHLRWRGRKSRPSAVKYYVRGVALMFSPRLYNKTRCIKSCRPTPSHLHYIIVRQCKVITTIVAWLLWTGKDQTSTAWPAQSNQVCTLQGVKPQDKTTTQSIITLVNTENTEVANNKQIKTVNLTSYRQEKIRTSTDNLVVDAKQCCQHSQSQIQSADKYQCDWGRNF